MTAKTAPVKPKFLVVEESLKCQTENGELSLSLRVKWGVIRKMLTLDGGQAEEFDFIMSHLLSPETNEFLDELDGAEVAAILTEFSEALAGRMRVSMGKSAGSSPSSTGTEQP